MQFKEPLFRKYAYKLCSALYKKVFNRLGTWCSVKHITAIHYGADTKRHHPVCLVFGCN